MRSARAPYADHALYYYNNIIENEQTKDHALYYYNNIIENEQTKDRLDKVPDPSLEVEDMRHSLFSAKIERSWSCW